MISPATITIYGRLIRRKIKRESGAGALLFLQKLFNNLKSFEL